MKRLLGCFKLTRVQTILDQWVLRGAFPVSYSPGAWDSHSDEFLIEEVTLTYDYFELVPRSNTPAVTDVGHVASRFPA